MIALMDYLFFFLSFPGGPGINGLFSLLPFSLMSEGTLFPFGLPMVASVTMVVPSLIPLVISV